ncbi:MAG: polyketide cyclase [Ilumatobacteraceae bacterium]|nr:polyketide cyclase [Ilumatobacteraceae bacterium]
MTTVSHTFEQPIITVFDALADPWTYPEWLVGAKDMRSVEPAWPSPGSSFHHRVGLGGPLTVADSSTSCEIEAPTLLVLEVRARPAGRARVTFRLTSVSHSSTKVEFSEVPIGPARLMTPVAAPLALVRNKRSLERLDEFLQGSGS